MIVQVTFALFLVVVAVLLSLRTWAVRRTYLTEGSDSASAAEADYFDRQFRRRTLTNGLIGLVGIAVFVGLWVSDPQAVAMFWIGVLMLVVAILALAAADMFSSQRFFHSVRRNVAVERAKLEAEAERLRAELRRHDSGNGHSPPERQRGKEGSNEL